jgi:hypothetical protein
MLNGPDAAWTFGDLLAGNRIICSSALFHASLLPSVEGFPEPAQLKALEDYALWLRIACLTEFTHLSAPLVRYRDEPVASVRADGLDSKTQRIVILADFLAWCRRHPGPRTRKARRIARRHRDQHGLWPDSEVPARYRLRRWLGRMRHGVHAPGASSGRTRR